MIFDANTTGLGDNTVMAEGYDCSYGCALALVEGARNDYQMFRAMLDVDAREMQLYRESADYVTEGQLVALSESAISGIWQKIKELFKKLAEKIKAIFHTFFAKINGLYMSDKKLIKKYSKEVYRKGNIGNLEVKWITFETGYATKATTFANSFTLSDGANYQDHNDKHNTDADKRHEYFTHGINAKISWDDFDSDMDDLFANGGDEETKEIKDIGGIRSIINYLDGYSKELRTLNKNCKDVVRNAEKCADAADKKANEYAKDLRDNKAGKDEAGMKEATKAHEMAVAYQDVVMKATQWVLNANKKEYAQNKAAFMKAVAANNDKLAESTYLDAVAEAAEQEVDDVISSALSKEELSKINNASLNVMDSDVSDDPDKLTYGPDYYTDNQSYVRTAGSIDTDIASRNETAFFGQLLY